MSLLNILSKSLKRLSLIGDLQVDENFDEFESEFEEEGVYLTPSGDSDRRLLYQRARILWNAIDTKQVSRLLGISISGSDEEAKKHMLRKKRVWPFYYPDPTDPTDYDRFPIELLSEFYSIDDVKQPCNISPKIVEEDNAKKKITPLRRPTLRGRLRLYSFAKQKRKSNRNIV